MQGECRVFANNKKQTGITTRLFFPTALEILRKRL